MDEMVATFEMEIALAAHGDGDVDEDFLDLEGGLVVEKRADS